MKGEIFEMNDEGGYMINLIKLWKEDTFYFKYTLKEKKEMAKWVQFA